VSSTLIPLMADLDEVRNVFGCKNKKLLKQVLEDAALADDDTDADEFEEAEDGDEDIDVDDIEELPSSRDALRHIIMGEPWARGIGSKYGYVFLALCQHLCEELDRANWGETRAEYVEAFDKVLRKVGVKAEVVSLSKLTDGHGDFPLPPRADFPFIGSMTAAEVARAATALGAVDRAALEAASKTVKISRGEVDSTFVVECFDELRGWCETCAAARKGLIIFYH
jgi:hypothetical protein